MDRVRGDFHICSHNILFATSIIAIHRRISTCGRAHTEDGTSDIVTTHHAEYCGYCYASNVGQSRKERNSTERNNYRVKWLKGTVDRIHYNPNN